MSEAVCDGVTVPSIHRGTIVERVLQRPATALFLLHAPAGFGKTCTLAQIRADLATRGRPTAWVTCGRALRTEADVVRHLHRQLSDQGQDVGPADAGLSALLARIAPPLALFIDNANAPLDAALRAALRAAPDTVAAGVTLFWASRKAFAFADEKLLLDERVHAFDAGELLLTPAQAREFLRRKLGADLAASRLDRLVDFAGGWPAILGLLCRNAPLLDAVDEAQWPAAVAGGEIGRYVRDEVLGAYTSAWQDALRRTSILRTLEPRAVRAVSGASDAERMLGRLWEEGLIELGDTAHGPRQRLNRVLRCCLFGDLVMQQPVELFRLHRLAASWYDEAGRPLQAIAHALDGRDYALASSLLVVHGRTLLESGRMRRLSEWLDQLPDYCIAGSVRLQLLRVWSSCFIDGPHQALRHLRAHGLHESTDLEIVQHGLALQTLGLSMSDRHDEARAAGERGLARVPTQAPFADAILINALANVHWILGDPDRARALLKPTAGAAPASGFGAMYAFTIEGAMDIVEGRLRQARARLALALSNEHAPDEHAGRGNAWAGVVHASCVYESGDHAAAAVLLERHLELGRGAGQPDHLSLGLVLQSRIAWDRDDRDRALHLLNELERLGEKLGLQRLTAAAQLERARQYTARGNGAAARECIARAQDLLDWERQARLRLLSTDVDLPCIARLRLEAVEGDARAALAGLDTRIAQAEAQRRMRRALKLRIIRCGALFRAADASAFAAVRSVLMDCCAEGYLSILLEERAVIRDVLSAFAADPQALAMKKQDPILAEYLAQLLQRLRIERADRAGGAEAGLSVKEIRTLRLLAEGHSNKVMADRLFLSDSTVRTHLRNINAKLGARTRTEAVAIGRRLGILE